MEDELRNVTSAIDGALLEDVRVATPCPANWDDMVGDDVTRFCGGCGKNVTNLSAMTRDDAEAFLGRAHAANPCVRFYRRVDGTIMEGNCPTGVQKRRVRLALIGGAAAAAAAAAAALVAPTYVRDVPCRGESDTATKAADSVRSRGKYIMGDWLAPQF